MNIYLAAKFGEKAEMRKWAVMLRDAGHVVTSSWLSAQHDSDAAATPEILSKGAVDNLKDVNAADVLVTKSQLPGTAHTGGGRHFEFGYATAIGKPVVVVGPKGEHVFHYLPRHVRHVPDVETLLQHLNEMKEFGA